MDHSTSDGSNKSLQQQQQQQQQSHSEAKLNDAEIEKLYLKIKEGWL